MFVEMALYQSPIPGLSLHAESPRQLIARVPAKHDVHGCLGADVVES